MSLSRYAKKRDLVEPEIVEALKGFGAKVWKLDKPYDLLVGFHGRFVVLECKSGKARLTPEQAEELDACKAGGLPVYVVRSVDEALRAVEVVS